MEVNRIVFLSVLGIIFVSSGLMNLDKLDSVKVAFGYVVMFLLGLHFCYAYVFNTKMYAQGVYAETNEKQPRVRAFYGVAGMLIIAMSYYGVWFW